MKQGKYNEVEEMNWQTLRLREKVLGKEQSARFLNKHLETFTQAENRLSGRNFCTTESGHVAWVSLYANSATRGILCG